MLTIGEWLFDAPTRRLLRGNEERRLSPKAAGVLSALAEMRGQVWSRDALLERVWPAVTVGEEVLTHAIAELRKALGDDFRKPRYLQTVHKSGYRLVCAGSGDEVPPHKRHDGAFDLPSYGHYLEGCELFERGGRRNTLMAAEIFAALTRAHQSFALAHVGLAKALTFLGTYYVPRMIDIERALEHAHLAQRIAPQLSEAHAIEGLIYALAGQSARSVDRFGEAIACDHNSGETHYFLGRACIADLDFKLAAPALERAASLRPDDYHSLVLAGKVRERTDNAERARTNYVLALPRIETKLSAHPDDYRALCFKARGLWYLGRRDEAAVLVDRVAAHPDPMNYHLACTLARMGETRRALDVLEQVVELGWRQKSWLDRDPDFDRLRDDRRFKRIASSIGQSGAN